MVMRRGDYIDDLVGYVENNLKKGYREDQLRFLLINQGYSRSAVEKAFRMFYQKNPRSVPTVQVVEKRVVEAIHEEMPEPKRGFFSSLFSMFSSKKSKGPAKMLAEIPSQPAPNLPEKVKIDSQGNLIE